MKEKVSKTKEFLKKWKRQKEQIIAEENWTTDSLIKFIRDLRATYLKMTTELALNKSFKLKKKKREFNIQINEVLSCIWYCKELHLYYLLFPYNVKEHLAYITSSVTKYKQFIADHHYLYLDQLVSEHTEVEYPIANLNEVMNQEFLTTSTITYAKARFYAIDLLINYFDKQLSKSSSLNTIQLPINKLQWMRSKIDLSVLIVSLAKNDCFTCHLGEPISTTQLVSYFEGIIDIDLKKDIHQTFNNVFKQKEDKSIFKDLSNWLGNLKEV